MSLILDTNLWCDEIFHKENQFWLQLAAWSHGASDYNLALFILSHPKSILTWKNRTRIKPFITKKVFIVYGAIFHCSHWNGKLYYPLCILKFNHAIQSLSSKISIKLLKTILERWILSNIFLSNWTIVWHFQSFSWKCNKCDIFRCPFFSTFLSEIIHGCFLLFLYTHLQILFFLNHNLQAQVKS